MSRFSLILFLFILLMAACSKKDKPSPGTTSTTYYDHISIRNDASQAIHLFFYNTRVDYINNTNPVTSLRLESGETYRDTFIRVSDSNLYFDWYTDDHVYGNWGQSHYFTIFIQNGVTDTSREPSYSYNFWDIAARFNAEWFSLGEGYVFDPNFPIRECLIHFNNPQTKWRCVYFSNGLVNWDTAPDWQKDLAMTLRKDQQYFLSGYDADGMPINCEGGFTAYHPLNNDHYSKNWYLQNWNNNPKDFAYLRIRHHTGGTDTLEVQHYKHTYYFTEK